VAFLEVVVKEDNIDCLMGEVLHPNQAVVDMMDNLVVDLVEEHCSLVVQQLEVYLLEVVDLLDPVKVVDLDLIDIDFD
jgi:hypothetical protein